MFWNNNSTFKRSKLQNSISSICNSQYNYFLNMKNVVGVACGYKVKNGFRTNQLCIQVFVSKKVRQSRLRSNDIIPVIFKGIETDVVESGVIFQTSLRQRIRPFQGGYSISPNMEETIHGTAGCLVTNGVSKFILSTNHVLAKGNELSIGYPIVQPASEYGGFHPNDTVATLNRYIPLRFNEGAHRPINFSDCALGLLSKPNIMSPEIAFIGKLQGVKSPVLNSKVKKVGSTSELTEGTITNIDGAFEFQDSLGRASVFNNLIVTTMMTFQGDSGSILVNEYNYGIGMACGRSNIVSVYCRLDRVLDQLDVQLITN